MHYNIREIKIDFFLVFLILISIFLCYSNYTQNTFLSGWDTLHPEFNKNLYWERINSMWQEHQALGAPPSQSHASEIPRMIFVFFSSLIFPQNFIRYSYFFLMINLGPIGIYFFLRYILYQGGFNYNNWINKISSFFGALFYLLNLGTMQHFIVSFEMFATKFGILGFLYLFAVKFLNEEGKKNLIIFSLLTILASPMAHTATLWYVYFAGLVLFLVSYSLLIKSRNCFKKSLLLIILTLFLNSYWIFPNLYYVTNYNNEVITSKIHRLNTEEFYYHNKKYGNIFDFLLFKNFLFDWYVTINNGKTQSLLIYWKEHLKNPYILIIGYFLSIVSLIGIVFIIHKKHLILLSFLPILFLCSFFLLSDMPVTFTIFDWLRNTRPLIKEVFRFPFTKFSIYLIFCFSLFFGYFHYVFLKKVSSILSKFLNSSLSIKIFFTNLYLHFFLFLILIYTLPAFSGNFINQIVRVRIPKEYFSLFRWSRKQNYGRILFLPIHNPYGWIIYQWNKSSNPQVYQGSGFTWFGLKQPTINSEFNRWYPYNEQSYREFFYAIYSQNPLLFEKLLQKYHITYILLDENVIVPVEGETSKKLFYPQIKELLKKTENLKLVKKFGQKISLFEYLPNKEKLPVEILTDYKIVEPAYHWNYLDEAYQKFGNYITPTKSSKMLYDNLNLIIYPTRNILTEQEKINQKILSINKDFYQIILPKTSIFENGIIKIPNLSNTESEFYSEVYAKKNNYETIIEIKYLLPYFVSDEVYKKQFILKDKNQKFFSLNDKVFFFPENLSKNPIYLGEVILFTQKENHLSFYEDKFETLQSNFSFTLSTYICSNPSPNQIFGEEIISSGFKIYAQAAKICTDIPLNKFIKIKEEGALSLTFDYQTQTNEENEFCFFDQIKNQCLLTKKIKPSFSSTINFLVPVNKENLNSYLLKFAFDTRKETKIKEMVIKNFQFNFYKKIAEEKFLPQIPSFKTETKEFKLLGKFPHQKIEITPNIIGEEKNNCGFEKPKLIDKKFIQTSEGTILEYKAIDGSICDSFPLLHLSQNIGYILAIESQNLSGLPLKICLEDGESSICHLEERLSKNKNLSFDYFIIPPYYQKSGYRLFINNYSIGNVASINRIKTIQLIPFPYKFFQAIRWESENQKKALINQSNNLKVKKHFPWLYSITLEDNIAEDSLLVLDQAYEKNWKAYHVVISKLKIKNFLNTYLPFLFGQPIKNHVLVNNWANGWIIKFQNSNLKSQNKIIIIFLPQYLQFLGFGFLFVGLVFVFSNWEKNF